MNLPIKYRILGLDISTASTGWGIIDVDNGKKNLIDYGCIERKKLKIEEAIVLSEEKFINIIEKYTPNYISVEAPFVGKNRDTIQKLCYIHGIMLLVAAKKKIPVTYYSVMTLKSSVLGGVVTKKENGDKKTGDELKEEVAVKVIEILGKKNFNKPYTNDVTDALSAIITFINKDGQPIEKIKKTKKPNKAV